MGTYRAYVESCERHDPTHSTHEEFELAPPSSIIIVENSCVRLMLRVCTQLNSHCDIQQMTLIWLKETTSC